MARIFTEDFDTGTDGTLITTGNSAFEYVSNSPRYSADASIVGPLGMVCSPAGTAQMGFGNRTSVYMRAYVTYLTLGTIAWHWNIINNTPSTVATLRVNANGTIRIMPGTSGTILETSGVGRLTAGEPARLEWGIDGTTMQLRMYLGPNLHGTDPDYDTGPVTWAGATFDRSQIGDLSSSGQGVHVDALAADDTTWVGPAQVEEPTDHAPWKLITDTGPVPLKVHII